MASQKGVALVTGSARGIGRAIALRLAQDGYDIALNDLRSAEQGLQAVEAELKAKGRRVHVAYADISVEEDVVNMIKSTVEALGSLNVVSNACLENSTCENDLSGHF